jgi:tetratricopeptide (TPR) repeat protein
VNWEVNVEPLLSRLPANVRGRGELLEELEQQFRSGGLVILVGKGGVGKSTVARELVRRMSGRDGRARFPVWEVSAAAPSGAGSGVTEAGSLGACFFTVARRLGAAKADQYAIATGAPSGPDRLWKLLERAPKGWLLVIDNADDPRVLASPAPPGSESPPRVTDGNGWVRAGHRGLVLVTSRQGDRAFWPPDAILYKVPALSDEDAAEVLRDQVRQAGSKAEAEALARRLGGLPLALYLAGRYLHAALEAGETCSFEAYRRAFDADLAGAIGRLSPDPDSPEAGDERAIVMRTWELSLDALAERGLPQTRPLLRLLSCYAPALPIPRGLLNTKAAESFISTAADLSQSPQVAGISMGQALRGLSRLGLVDEVPLFTDQNGAAAGSLQARAGVLGNGTGVVVHPVIADTNRVFLLQHDGPHPLAHQALTVLADGLDTLTDNRMPDWAVFRLFSPHLQALASAGSIMLDDGHLSLLIRQTGRTAVAYGQMNAPAFGVKLIISALMRAGRYGGSPPPDVLVARQQLAMLLSQTGQHRRAEEVYRAVLAAQPRYWPADDPANLAVRHNLAEIVGAQGPSRWPYADAAFLNLLKDEYRVLGEDHPLTLATRREHATLLCRQGRWAEAESAYRTLLAAERRILGGDSLASLVTRFNLAHAVARREGRHDEADALTRGLLQDAQRVLGNDHPVTAAIREGGDKVLLRRSLIGTAAMHEDAVRAAWRKAQALSAQGKRSEAAVAFVDLTRRYGADQDPEMKELVARSLLWEAWYHCDANRLQKAEEKVETASARFEELRGTRPEARDEGLASARQVQTRVAYEQAESLRASDRESEAEKAFADIVQRFGADPIPEVQERVARSEFWLARYYSRTGQQQDAAEAAADKAAARFDELNSARPGVFTEDLQDARQLQAWVRRQE